MNESSIIKTPIFCVVVFTTTYYYLNNIYKQWRQNEIHIIHTKCIQLLTKGYILIDSVPSHIKCQIWESNLLPRLLSHWKTIIPDFSLNNQSTWPQPENGRAYHTTLQNNPNTPELTNVFSSNYEVQCILAYLFDEQMQLVRYSSSHWKYELLCHPLLLIIPSYLIKHVFQDKFIIHLKGADYAWHLLNWSNPKYGQSGVPVSRNSHFDNGFQEFGTLGMVPLLPNASSTIVTSTISNTKSVTPITPNMYVYTKQSIEGVIEREAIDVIPRRLMSMILQQLGIIFYCDTPGSLGSEEGCTAFFDGSHFVVLSALSQYISANPQEKIEYSQIFDAVKDYGQQYMATSLRQFNIPDGKALLGFGLTVHTLMWAVKPMTSIDSKGNEVKYPRSIQNAKIQLDCTLSSDTHVFDLFDMLGEDSLLKRLVIDPLQLYTALEKESIAMSDTSNNTSSMDLYSSQASYLFSRIRSSQA